MGCTNCGSGDTPGGCKNQGTCSSGGCNKLEVYDWLGNMMLPSGQAQYDIIEVRFKNSRKSFYRNTKNHSLQVGDVVVVEGSPGQDIGEHRFYGGAGGAAMAGNVLIGGVIGAGVDSVTGAAKVLSPNPLKIELEACTEDQ